MSATANASALIIEFVRGKVSWKTLERAGVFVELKDDGYEIDNPWQVAAKVHLRDVSEGLLVYQRIPDQMQRWAGIILAGSSFLDLSEEFETTPDGDILLNALWDAAFGDEVSQEAVDVAEGLTSG
jgi:hypothetical protein